MRDEQDFFLGGLDLDQLDDSALAEEIGDEAADAIAAKGAENGDDRLSVALGQIPTWQHAAIVLAISRWIEARKGLDDQLWPTLRQLRTRIAWLSHLAARGGERADQHRADADALRALFAALTGGMSAGGLDDEGLDDDTDDGLDDLDDDGVNAERRQEMQATEHLLLDAEDAGLCTCGAYGDERPLWAPDCPQHDDSGDDCAWRQDDDDGLDDDTDDDGLDDDTDDDGLDDDTDDDGLDDEGLDGPLWRELAAESELRCAPLSDEEIAARVEGEIADELRGLAALGLTPLQWIGAFSKAWDYTTTPPLYWHAGGLQRLEVLAELRGWVLAHHDTDALTIAGAAVVAGGDAQPTIYDAIRWESAWAALDTLNLWTGGGCTDTRRAFFDGLGLIDPSPAAFPGFCDLLGEWAAEIWAAVNTGRHQRPSAPTLKAWLARTDAAVLTRELARVQPGHAEGRVALWRAWGPFIGDAWAIKEALPWAGAISKGGE